MITYAGLFGKHMLVLMYFMKKKTQKVDWIGQRVHLGRVEGKGNMTETHCMKPSYN